MRHTRLLSLSVSRNAITGGVTVCDDDATWDIPQRPCLVREFSSRDDVPWTGEIFCGDYAGRDSGLRLVGLKAEPVDSRTTDDSAAQRQRDGIHQDCGIFEIANKLHCRRPTVRHRNRFTE